MKGLDALIRTMLLAGAIALPAIGAGSCRTLSVAMNESALEDAIKPKVERRAPESGPRFSEEEYQALQDAVYTKMEWLYFDKEATFGSEKEFGVMVRADVVGDEFNLKYALHIGLEEIHLGIDPEVPVKSLPTTRYKPGKNTAIGDLTNPECPVVAFYNDDTNTIYWNYAQKYTQHYAAHETSHGAVDDESKANYLALRGAIESGDPGWQMAEFHFLYWSIKAWRFSSPPQKCSDTIKDKWQQYYQGYVDLVLGDDTMREYFGIDERLAYAREEAGDAGVSQD